MSSTKLSAAIPLQHSFQIFAQQTTKLPPCQAQCANSGDIRAWLGIIAQHEKVGLTLDEAYDKAWEKLTELNPLPATIGRICPHPCEDHCTRGNKDGAVSINGMERFLGDWALSRSLPLGISSSEQFEEPIGVIGSGPASLSFAYQMARRGYSVTIYEKYDLPGGMLRHAIPDYRLPREVLDAEIERLLELRISLVRNAEIGSNLTLEELRDRYEVIFLGLGAPVGRELGIPGEDGPGVIPGIAYLRGRKQRTRSQIGKRVAVIGGGNTAIDAARSARREGSQVTVLYRRSEIEMPAVAHEVEDARKEGVRFRFLVSPSRFVHESGELRKVELQDMRLGKADEQGRRRPVPIPGKLQSLSVDTAIVAVSQVPEGCGISSSDDGHEWLCTDDDGKLDDNIWAGGDDRGPGIASHAIAQGRRAAEAVHAELRGEPHRHETLDRKAVIDGTVKTDYYREQQRRCRSRRPEAEWLSQPELEIEQTMSSEQAFQEAARCMSCGLCFDCRQCFMYCNAGGFSRIKEPEPGHYFALDLEACEGCSKCIEVCPCGYLDVRK